MNAIEKKLYVAYKILPNGSKHELKRFWYKTACLNYCLKNSCKYFEKKVEEVAND